MPLIVSARTTLTAPDIVACLRLLTETVSNLVADGNFVKTELGDFYLCAKGSIDGRKNPSGRARTIKGTACGCASGPTDRQKLFFGVTALAPREYRIRPE
jgi:hypothetical protein